MKLIFYTGRFKVTDDVHEREKCADNEIKLARWLTEFGPFRGIRM